MYSKHLVNGVFDRNNVAEAVDMNDQYRLDNSRISNAHDVEPLRR
jgi:hypothetical protein